MSFLKITRETWNDLTVNLIPLGILLLMDLLYWVVNPWGWDPVVIAIAHFLTIFPMLCLGLLTYVSGRAIQQDEGKNPIAD
jgi:hypothetical protein